MQVLMSACMPLLWLSRVVCGCEHGAARSAMPEMHKNELGVIAIACMITKLCLIVCMRVTKHIKPSPFRSRGHTIKLSILGAGVDTHPCVVLVRATELQIRIFHACQLCQLLSAISTVSSSCQLCQLCCQSSFGADGQGF